MAQQFLSSPVAKSRVSAVRLVPTLDRRDASACDLNRMS
jgi:hypothetical protein